MSIDDANEAQTVDRCCTSCGKAESDEMKLKDCDKCDLARFCSDECQQVHREIHGATCKARAAELRDEVLFRQPESSHLGDCPICCLPLPGNTSTLPCCFKTICDGCCYVIYHEIDEVEIEEWCKIVCPFCRTPAGKFILEDEAKTMLMKRVAVNDPTALNQMGGRLNEEGNYDEAFQYSTRAAELGDAGAHFVEKDEKMAIYHLEEAAIAADPYARSILGSLEWDNERYDRAVKHWIISANLGHDYSLQKLNHFYKNGLVSKDDFAAARRAHKAAVDATKSSQREEAKNFLRDD